MYNLRQEATSSVSTHRDHIDEEKANAYIENLIEIQGVGVVILGNKTVFYILQYLEEKKRTRNPTDCLMCFSSSQEAPAYCGSNMA